MKKLIFLLTLIIAMSASAQLPSVQREMSNCPVGIFIGKKIIAPIKFYKQKIGSNAFAAGLTYGIAKVKNKNYYKNPTSNNVVNVGDTITFKFGNIPTQYMANMFMFANTYSPNSFAVVEMSKKKDHREVTTADISIWAGADLGVKGTDKVKMDVADATDNEYRFVITEAKPGEYCFVWAEGGLGAYQYIFDFSVAGLTKK